jgi:septal ring factor EnvC (AmiA/AmiB activator)
MVMDEIASLITSNIVTIVGSVWYVSTRVSSLNHRLERIEEEMGEIKKEIRQSRESRAKIYDKMRDLSERVTVQEVKNKSTRVG